MTEKIVTRPYSADRFLDPQHAVDPIPYTGNILAESFFIPGANWKPAETANILIAQLADGRSIYAHCRQQQTEDLASPSVQIFSDDIILGNLNREGFFRLLTYFSTEGKVVRDKMVERLRELKRYQNGSVLTLEGFHYEESASEQK